MNSLMEIPELADVPEFETPPPVAHTAPALDQNTAALSGLVLPGGNVSISESAKEIFRRIAPSHKLFLRGGAVVELAEMDGAPSLELLKPDSFRSRVERFGNVFAWRAGAKGVAVLQPTTVPKDTAVALLASSEAREILPPIASVLNCPVLVETAPGEVTVLGKGYHPNQGGLLIVGGETPPRVPFDEAVKALLWIIEEFDFQSEGDRSRALAALITPELRIGGHLDTNCPLDVAEADLSQSGKGYRHELVTGLYREIAYVVARREGGVGSADESFAAGLIAGRPFIQLDNLRGRIDSQYLESFVTAPGLFPARVPRRGEVLINPRRFIIQLTSNGFESTQDLANRASICRIRKRPEFPYRDTRGEVQRRQPYFLGCVFSIVAEWLARGKPKTTDRRHDFVEWAQTLDWICQNLLGAAPMLDGHKIAQERVSNPALAWLRSVAVAIEGENRLGQSLIATEICELCDLHGIEIPGNPSGEILARQQVGSLCKRVFREGERVEVDGFVIARGPKTVRKPSGDLDTTHGYTVTR